LAADEWVRGITMWLRWRSRAWKKQALVSPVAEAEATPVAAAA